MAVIRVNKSKNYTVMSNYHFKDKNMSLKAKGLLSMMLSLPDNWNYSVEGFVTICKESKTSIQSTLKELEDLKYLKRTKTQNTKGQFKYIYDIYEKPQTENACMDNISQLNTKELNTNDINNISSFNENDEELKKHFELIWDKYPNKTGKTKSKEYFYQWIKGKRISKETIKLTDKQMYYAVSKYAKECEEKGIEQQYIKHGDTFFNKAILDYVEADNE